MRITAKIVDDAGVTVIDIDKEMTTPEEKIQMMQELMLSYQTYMGEDTIPSILMAANLFIDPAALSQLAEEADLNSVQ